MFFLKVSLVDFVLLDKSEGKSVLAVSGQSAGQSARAVQPGQSSQVRGQLWGGFPGQMRGGGAA